MTCESSPALGPNAGLEYLLHPLPLSVFFEQYWEKRPLLLKRDDPLFYSKLFSRSDVEFWFKEASCPAAVAAKNACRPHEMPTRLKDLNDSVRTHCTRNHNRIPSKS